MKNRQSLAYNYLDFPDVIPPAPQLVEVPGLAPLLAPKPQPLMMPDEPGEQHDIVANMLSYLGWEDSATA